MVKRYILALDQGTTSSRAIIFNHLGQLVAKSQKELTQIYPQPGWVEHDPLEIWETQLAAAREVLQTSGINPGELSSLGITNQRETTVIWDRITGQPVYNAIVWQCRRTTDLCESIINRGLGSYIYQQTGLVVDAYFSAPKIRWLLDHIPQGQFLAEQGDLIFGTIDSWLAWNLTKGDLHITDYSNASRTMLYNIHDLCWDQKILSELNIPTNVLPQVRQTSEVYGVTDSSVLGLEIPIGSLAGDQQAALFGQKCFDEGMAKNTYGTGCFLLMNTGQHLIRSNNKLLSTIAWGLEGKITYALEGSVFIGGAVIQWLRDELGFLKTAAESEYYANQVPDTNGVYFVPAFVGLGAPYWDMHARGTITGITRGTNRQHIIRAALESIAFQATDVLSAMQKDTGIPLKTLKVDGGGANNKFLLQFQADIAGIPVQPSTISESTALGAAYLAGLATGFWDMDQIRNHCHGNLIFSPAIPASARLNSLMNWQIAIKHTLSS